MILLIPSIVLGRREIFNLITVSIFFELSFLFTTCVFWIAQGQEFSRPEPGKDLVFCFVVISFMQQVLTWFMKMECKGIKNSKVRKFLLDLCLENRKQRFCFYQEYKEQLTLIVQTAH